MRQHSDMINHQYEHSEMEKLPKKINWSRNYSSRELKKNFKRYHWEVTMLNWYAGRKVSRDAAELTRNKQKPCSKNYIASGSRITTKLSPKMISGPTISQIDKKEKKRNI